MVILNYLKNIKNKIMDEFLLRLIYFVLITGTIFLDAFSDGILDKMKKRNHYTESLLVVFFLGITTMMWYFPLEPLIIVLTYLFLRVSIFNPIYNKTRGNPIFYTGTTDKIFDKWLNKLGGFGGDLIKNLLTYGSFIAAIMTILWKVSGY